VLLTVLPYLPFSDTWQDGPQSWIGFRDDEKREA